MTEYAFDVHLKAVIRVEASSIREARRKIYRLDAVSADDLPFYDARLTEFSVHRCARVPFETDDVVEPDE